MYEFSTDIFLLYFREKRYRSRNINIFLCPLINHQPTLYICSLHLSVCGNKTLFGIFVFVINNRQKMIKNIFEFFRKKG